MKFACIKKIPNENYYGRRDFSHSEGILWEFAKGYKLAFIDYENLKIRWMSYATSFSVINDEIFITSMDGKLQILSSKDGVVVSQKNLPDEGYGLGFIGHHVHRSEIKEGKKYFYLYNTGLQPIVELVQRNEDIALMIVKSSNKYILKAEQVKLGDNGQHYAPLLEFYDFQGNLISEVDVTQLANQTFGSKSFSDKVGLLSPAHLLLHENKLLFRVGGLKTTMTACVDIPSGKIDWVNEVAALWSQVKDDIVYVCQEGKIIKIDIKTGNTLEVLPVLLPDDVSFNLKGQWSFFSIHDGHIYTTHIGEATMMVIHIETGKLVSRLFCKVLARWTLPCQVLKLLLLFRWWLVQF